MYNVNKNRDKIVLVNTSSERGSCIKNAKSNKCVDQYGIMSNVVDKTQAIVSRIMQT